MTATETRTLLRDLLFGAFVCGVVAPAIALTFCTLLWVAIYQFNGRGAHNLQELWSLTTFIEHTLFVYMTRSLLAFGAMLGIIEVMLLRWASKLDTILRVMAVTTLGACLGSLLGFADGTLAAVGTFGLYGAYSGLAIGVLFRFRALRPAVATGN